MEKPSEETISQPHVVSWGAESVTSAQHCSALAAFSTYRNQRCASKADPLPVLTRSALAPSTELSLNIQTGFLADEAEHKGDLQQRILCIQINNGSQPARPDKIEASTVTNGTS